VVACAFCAEPLSGLDGGPFCPPGARPGPSGCDDSKRQIFQARGEDPFVLNEQIRCTGRSQAVLMASHAIATDWQLASSGNDNARSSLYPSALQDKTEGRAFTALGSGPPGPPRMATALVRSAWAARCGASRKRLRVPPIILSERGLLLGQVDLIISLLPSCSPVRKRAR
jgi:hypothetical protein